MFRHALHSMHSNLCSSRFHHSTPSAFGLTQSLITAACTWKWLNAILESAQRYIHKNFVNSLISCALKSIELSPSTERAYLSDLGLLHKLYNLDGSVCNNFLAKLILRGAENLSSTASPNAKNCMSLFQC
jgi:hypothetical protein